MPEHSGFVLKQVKGRSIVRLRIRPDDADVAAKKLQLPQALMWRDSDPAVCWLGPDQWLYLSDTKPADDIIRYIDSTLAGQLHAATDMSSGNVCFAIRGHATRTVLAMGCGLDLHPSVFMAGQCARTNFANIPLLIVAISDHHLDLYLDRSYAQYLVSWFAEAGNDPVTYN